MIIYQIVNNVNKKVYIGQTCFDLEKRFAEHVKNSRRKNPKYYIHRAIKKYGFENFSCYKLTECERQNELDQKEIEFMELYNSLAPHGYNMVLNSGGGDNFSSHVNKNEIRKRISEGTKRGIAKSEKSWSESHKGSKNGMYGQKHSKETIEKMRRNRRGKCLGDDNPTAKNAPKYLITTPDGNKFIIKNQRKFCRDSGVNRYNLRCGNHGWKCEKIKTEDKISSVLI